jgi:HAD superfamily hydrolase (TIGR01509 family)
MVTTIIFDVDGTLVDTNYLHTEAFARALRAVGQPHPRARIHRQIGKGSDQLLPELVRGEAEQQRVAELHGQFFRELRDTAFPLPGARELIASLRERGYRLWLASSANPEELEPFLGQLEAKQRLEGIVSSADVDESKPEPDLFQAVLRRSGIPAEEALVVGDTRWDALAAVAAGLRMVGVLTGGAYSRAELHEAGAVAVYDDCAAMLGAGFPDGF